MARTHPFEPIHPHLTLGRLAAGAVGGIVGGLLFGVMLLTDFLIRDPTLGGKGMVPLAQEVLGSTSPMLLWGIHALMSIALGLIFSMVISPRSYRSSILYALGYSQIVWIGSLVVLRSLTGETLEYDPAAVYSQMGHALFGLGLGIFYVGFHHEEVRDAMRAQSEKWRKWGEKERQEEGNG